MSIGFKNSKEKRKMPREIYRQEKYKAEEKYCSEEALRRFKEKPYILKAKR